MKRWIKKGKKVKETKTVGYKSEMQLGEDVYVSGETAFSNETVSKKGKKKVPNHL